jgi:hypothetical protein
MTQLSITVTPPAELVRKSLQDLGSEIPKIGRMQIYRTAQAIVREMKLYPPAPPMSTYVRTGTLGGGWQITSKPDGYTIRNDTPYTKYVVGNAYGLEQAWMHQGRWKLQRDVTEQEVGKLPQEIENEISLAARRLGL